MARATPLRPERYTPRTYVAMQEQLSEALAEHIERNGITTGEIRERYRTIRAGHLKRLRPDLDDAALDAEVPQAGSLRVPRTDDCEHFNGIKILLAMAEAVGLKVELKVAA